MPPKMLELEPNGALDNIDVDERHWSPYDKAILWTLENLGADNEAILGFFEEHPLVTRIAADSFSAARVGVGFNVMDVYDKAIEEGDSKTALTATGAMLGILASDFLDGFIARAGRQDGGKWGKYVDATSDLILRGRILKSIKADNDDPNFTKIDQYMQYARAGGDALVGLSTIPDYVMGKYETTMLGKIKVNFDAAYVLSLMIEKALTADPEREDAPKSLRVMKMTGLIGSTTIAYADGYNRIKTKLDSRRK